MLDSGDRQGEEFRTDLRPLATSAAGSGNASARRILSAAELGAADRALAPALARGRRGRRWA
jgi:hypothetical protein